MTYPGLSIWNGSSKIQYFIDIWNSFCWRLWRPWMLLSTKSKGHKSNFRISEMYRFCFYDLKVHFLLPNKHSKHQVLRLNTLYKLLASIMCGTFNSFLAGLGQKSSVLCMLLCPKME